MIKKGIKDLIKKIRVTSVAVDFGIIKLSLAGGFSKVNMYKSMELKNSMLFFFNL